MNVDAHSELMGAYPWGSTTPNESTNVPDHGAFQDGSLVFTDDGTVGGGVPVHHYAALVASNRTPSSGTAAATGGNFRGPEPGTVCAADRRHLGAELLRRRALRQGHRRRARLHRVAAGPRLHHAVDRGGRLGPGAVGRQGHSSPAPSPTPTRSCRPRSPRATCWPRTRWSRCPATALLQNAVQWGKQNLADLTQSASNLQIRWTNQGTQYPAALGTVAHAKWFAAGFPDYPWIFSTDGEYTAFPAVAVGQFQTIEDHLTALARDLRHPQPPVGDRRARDRLRRLGVLRPRQSDDRQRRHRHQRLQHRRDGQVPKRRRARVAMDR